MHPLRSVKRLIDPAQRGAGAQEKLPDLAALRAAPAVFCGAPGPAAQPRARLLVGNFKPAKAE